MGRIIPYIIWKIKNVWNHQPESDLNLKMVILNFAKKNGMSPNIMRIQMGFKWNNEYYVYTYLYAYVYMYNDSMINTLISEVYPQLLGFTNMTLGPLLVWNKKTIWTLAILGSVLNLAAVFTMNSPFLLNQCVVKLKIKVF